MSDKEWEEGYDATRGRAITPTSTSRPWRAGTAPSEDAIRPSRPALWQCSRFCLRQRVFTRWKAGSCELKYRCDRRPGLPIEPWGVFHWKLAIESAKKLRTYCRLGWQAWRIGRRVKNDPQRYEYTDLALTPVADEDMDKLALFAATAGGEAAVTKHRNEDLARARVTTSRSRLLTATDL